MLPSELPISVTAPKLNPYGIIIIKSPNATNKVYAATISSSAIMPVINTSTYMLVFSIRSIKTPGAAIIRNSFRFSNVL